MQSTNSRAPRMPSVWSRISQPDCGAGRRWALGLMTGRRKLASRAYYPGALDRAAIGEGVYPYWHVIDYSLAARDSADDRIQATDDFFLLAMMATSDRGDPSFRTQHFQMVDDVNGFRMSRTGINNANIFGTAQNPFILRRPFPMPNNCSLLNKIANMTTNTNAVQLVFYGMKRYQEAQP